MDRTISLERTVRQSRCHTEKEAESEDNHIRTFRRSLDRGLPKLVADHAARVARERGFSPGASTVVLLAHGSRQNPASREATEQMAAEVTKLGMCRAARVAFLEERPFLEEAVRT